VKTSELRALLAEPEGLRLECKQFKGNGSFDELCKYVAGIANSGGGIIALGVSDARPRTVVGTAAFHEPGKTVADVQRRLGHSVRIDEHHIDGHRVLTVEVPGRTPGSLVVDNGRYWYRVGEELLPMPDSEVRASHHEIERDFSAEVVPGLVLADLDQQALAEFSRRLTSSRPGVRVASQSADALLRDADLITPGGGLTYACLLLLGTRSALGQHLPQAEVIYEYRSSEAAGPAQERREFRQPLLIGLIELAAVIEQRNDRQSIQDGLFRQEISTFDEAIVRESLLNAVSHRDYRVQPSVLVVQYPRRLEVSSPGGFPVGVTTDNILGQQRPRNRRLAEALARLGLVERAGQGVNLMFERSVQQGKRVPSYAGSDAHRVVLVLDCSVSNPLLVRALERIGAEELRSYATEDFVVLDRLSRGDELDATLSGRLPQLVERGLVERQGRGRHVRHFLSKRVAGAIGQTGAYTRRKGLDASASAALLLTHLQAAGTAGAAMAELEQVLPSHSRDQIRALLSGLQTAGRIALKGSRRWARWVAVDANQPPMR
jgi:ATP-dependent DNA helicase RecG